ncbi:diguanylate cyclase [Pseudoalteromonas sp.]|uniref:GGDEF domain-containing response regulator n=1 Tax=Pseudoalteromonas sp. TaxID=53249 RepID=UPI00356A18B8
MTLRQSLRTTEHDSSQVNEHISSILVIEDQQYTSNMLKSMLGSHHRFSIECVANYQEAKAALSKNRHNYLVAICDLSLPDSPNGEIINLVNRSGVRIIALTGLGKESIQNYLNVPKLIDYVFKSAPNSIEYVVNLAVRLHKNQFIKVLIVDDSELSLSLLSEVMSLLNFQVLKAKNGHDALQIIKENLDIRLLITDHEMPVMSGFDLVVKAREIRAKDNLAIIGISSSQGDLGISFIKYGANDFLNKPYSFAELSCRINMNLEALEHLDHIHELANKDALTKLYNRRFLFEQGSQLLQSLSSNNRAVCVLILDIDFFKRINDTYGHDCGDYVLKLFSNILIKYFPNGLCARLGGEEFVVIQEVGEDSDISQQLDEFKTEIQNTTFKWDEKRVSFTVSIGALVSYGIGLENALKHADKNLYQAKSDGRNKVVLNSV